jgi:hypothetical protein
MNWQQDLAGESKELEQALKHFKTSMDAWSDGALSRPRTLAKASVRPSWRLAATWALGCLLAAGSLAGAVHRIVMRQEMAKQAAQKTARKTAEERAAAQATAQPDKKAPASITRKASGAQDSASGQDEALLASVDKDVSREVPAAMEPLAQLMDDSGTQ